MSFLNVSGRDYKKGTWLDGFEKLGEDSEAPESFIRWVGISCVASALQRKTWLTWMHGQKIFPNFYIILTGPPAVRKGTAMSFGVRILKELKQDIHLASDAVTREALIEELIDSKKSILVGTKPVIHNSLTAHAPELTIFINPDSPQLITSLTDWFDCEENWTNRTRSRKKETIEAVWLNILGATTPSNVKQIFTQSMQGGGLTSRLIFVCELVKRKTQPEPTLDHNLEKLLIKDLQRIAKFSGPFEPQNDFRQFWKTWYVKQDKEPPKVLRADVNFEYYLARRALHILKLSMVSSAVRSDAQILEAHDLKNAISWLEEAEQKMPYAFQELKASLSTEAIKHIMKILSVEKRLHSKELLETCIYYVDSLESYLQILALMKHANMIQIKNDYISLVPKP